MRVARVLLIFAVLTMLLGVATSFASRKGPTIDFEGQCVSPHDLDEQTLSRYQARDLSNSSRKTLNAARALDDVYEFFASEFNWASTDGQGGELLLMTNMAWNEGRGCSGMNAFSAGPSILAILYGKEGSSLDIASDIDVIGHEFTHGVFAATKRRLTFQEYGALNESIADMLGVTIKAWKASGKDFDNLRVDRDTYLLGKTFAKILSLYGKQLPDEALRNVAKPSRSRQPDHYRDAGSYDEVHALGGITNQAFYLLAEGGKHPRNLSNLRISGVGLKKASTIVFYTLRHLPFTTMKDFAKACQKAARKIYSLNSAEEKAVHNAFAAVGLFDAAFVPAPIPNPAPKKPTPKKPAPKKPAPKKPAPKKPAPKKPAPKKPVPKKPVPKPDPGQNPAPVPSPEPAPTPDGIQISTQTIIISLLVIIAGLVFLVLRVTGKNKSSADKPVQAPVAQPRQAAAPVERPRVKATSVSVELETSGRKFNLLLDEEPVVLGRQTEALPSALVDMLKADEAVSRQHCEFWYKAATEELYVRNLSSNGTLVNEIRLQSGEKGKVSINQAISIKMGRTRISLKKAN